MNADSRRGSPWTIREGSNSSGLRRYVHFTRYFASRSSALLRLRGVNATLAFHARVISIIEKVDVGSWDNVKGIIPLIGLLIALYVISISLTALYTRLVACVAWRTE